MIIYAIENHKGSLLRKDRRTDDRNSIMRGLGISAFTLAVSMDLLAFENAGAGFSSIVPETLEVFFPIIAVLAFSSLVPLAVLRAFSITTDSEGTFSSTNFKLSRCPSTAIEYVDLSSAMSFSLSAKLTAFAVISSTVAESIQLFIVPLS